MQYLRKFLKARKALITLKILLKSIEYSNEYKYPIKNIQKIKPTIIRL